MRAIFERSGGTYGSPLLHHVLTTNGRPISRRRVERLMRQGEMRARVVRISPEGGHAPLVRSAPQPGAAGPGDATGSDPVWPRFRDGTSGEIDLESVLEGPVFEPLRDPPVFRQFQIHPEFHTLIWANGADIAPEFLHDNVRVTT